MIRSALELLSPAGPQGRLSILIFHRVLPQVDPLFPDEPDAARFDQLMNWVRTWFNVLPLDHAVAAWRAGELPARAAAITFDDGYLDNREVALPILQKYGLPATFFIATGFLDGGRMWNDTIIESIRAASGPELDLRPLGLGRHANQSIADKRRAIDQLIGQIKYLPTAQRVDVTEQLARQLGIVPPDHLMMRSAQVGEMRDAGMQIGAHTCTHPILARLDAGQAEREIGDSKARLEALLGERVTLFAYPNGKPDEDYLPAQTRIVADMGFEAAVSTQWGAARRGDDPYQLPRFTPWDSGRLKFGMRLVRNLI